MHTTEQKYRHTVLLISVMVPTNLPDAEGEKLAAKLASMPGDMRDAAQHYLDNLEGMPAGLEVRVDS